MGIIQLTAAPYLEKLAFMPQEDYEGEGFAFFEEHPESLPKNAPWPFMNRTVFDRMRLSDDGYEELWVVRFRISKWLVVVER